MDNQELVNRGEFYDKMMEERIKHSKHNKFYGVAPEGFTLVPNEVLEQLKDFDTWKEFKNDEEWVEKTTKFFLKK
jgi:hypothetical protein